VESYTAGDTHADQDTNCNGDQYGDTHADAHGDTDSHVECNADRDVYSYANRDGHPDGYTYCHGDSHVDFYTDSDAYRYSHTDTNSDDRAIVRIMHKSSALLDYGVRCFLLCIKTLLFCPASSCGLTVNRADAAEVRKTRRSGSIGRQCRLPHQRSGQNFECCRWSA